LVIAFDADDAGRQGADRLAELLTALQRPPVVLDLKQGDVNDALILAEAWDVSLSERVASAANLSTSQARPTLAC
jgi:DNA primase